MTAEHIPLGLYLWLRIRSLGVEHIFGVPGDFNLTIIDHVYDVPGLKWLGTCNELNGAYAADGYTRIKGVPGALLTTYAVGELSAINGIAGAYAEHAGLIHIVGMPSRSQIKSRPLLHHTLEPNMDYMAYVRMSEPVRKTHTVLTDEATMAEEIDRVIVECARSKLPVYIFVPTDVVDHPVDASRLETPLDIEIRNDDSHAESRVVDDVLQAIKGSQKPTILGDALAIRHGGQDLVRKLVDLTHFPTFSTQLGKGIIHETSPYFNGIYNGDVSFPGIQAAVESSDLVLNIGPLLSNSNTGGFSRQIAEKNLIILGHDFCQIKSKKYEGIHFLPVLRRVVYELAKCQSDYNLPWKQESTPFKAPELSDARSGPLSQSYVWQRIGRFLKPNDIVVAECGTASFGMLDAAFPANVSYTAQIFWSSIGFSVGAALGSCVAARELNRSGRVILIVGDGSLQLTVQEVGSFMRFGFKPIIFVVNNDGYSIERAIHGEDAQYNDINTHWDYQLMLQFFGANSKSKIEGRSFSCKTVEEFDKLLSDDQFGKADYIQVCEFFLDKLDYPWRLSTQLAVTRAKIAAAAAAAKA